MQLAGASSAPTSPPGYRENTLKKYPVLFMQEGKNVFFPEEAFLGRDWNVVGSIALLDGMNAIDKVVVIGAFSGPSASGAAAEAAANAASRLARSASRLLLLLLLPPPLEVVAAGVELVFAY